MALLSRISFLPLFFAIFVSPVWASDVSLAEQKIKAGMIYNFLKYTEWPSADAQLPMVACLFGGDPFEGNLGPMQGRSVNLRTVEIRRINDTNAALKCHLIVVNDSADWSALRQAIQGKHILTVSNQSDFIRQGGMIQFGHQDRHIAVTLNMKAVRAAKVTLEQRLLNLVTVVQGGP